MTNNYNICWNEDISRQEAYRKWKDDEEPMTCCRKCTKELMSYFMEMDLALAGDDDNE